jgi:hypothetical protein
VGLSFCLPLLEYKIPQCTSATAKSLARDLLSIETSAFLPQNKQFPNRTGHPIPY